MGIEISPYISAALYVASCTALTYIKISVPGEVQHFSLESRSENIGAQFQSNAVSIHAQICELRNIRVRLRSQESARETFTPCNNPKHEKCGIVRGNDISFEHVGKCVLKIHAEIKTNFDFLIGKHTISKAMVEHFDSLDDDPQEFSNGFSFINRWRAEKLLKPCNELMANRIQKGNTEDDAVDLKSLQKWVQKATYTNCDPRNWRSTRKSDGFGSNIASKYCRQYPRGFC